jgi:hypothetical protein
MVLFVTGWLAPEVTGLLASALRVSFKVLKPDEAVQGFGSPALITLMGLFAVSAGLFRSGGLDRLRALIGSDVVKRIQTGRFELHWTPRWQVLSDDPLKALDEDDPLARSAVLRGFTAALGQAETSVVLISPYFVPGDAGSLQLTDMVKRGPSVAVLTNRRIELALHTIQTAHASVCRGSMKAHNGQHVPPCIGSTLAELIASSVVIESTIGIAKSDAPPEIQDMLTRYIDDARKASSIVVDALHAAARAQQEAEPEPESQAETPVEAQPVAAKPWAPSGVGRSWTVPVPKKGVN